MIHQILWLAVIMGVPAMGIDAWRAWRHRHPRRPG